MFLTDPTATVSRECSFSFRTASLPFLPMTPAITNTSDFPATHWTLIAAAGGPDRDTALSRLYQTYWRPLCAQARRFGVPEDDVEDAVQELFVNLFRSGAVERAERCRGRFRSYLLGALRNHLSHRRAHAQTQKRGAAQALVPLDSIDPSQHPEPAPMDTREFDAEWARALLDEALRRFEREERHSAASRASFDALSGCVLGDAEIAHHEAARSLGITEAAVKSRVFRLRQRFHEIVREEVHRTVASDAECDEELRYLCAVLDKVDGVPSLPLAV
jgi:RNA polymerase sigma-70 factor (ECF subfamily)